MRKIFVWGFLLLQPIHKIAPSSTRADLYSPISADPRIISLKRYLKQIGSPFAHLSHDFVEAADRYRLDWRLLPSIATIESGAGKNHRNQNIFGWNNGGQRFPSAREGLYYVGYRLSHSPLYARRSTRSKLSIYNSNPEYAEKVVAVMRRLGPRVLFERRQPSIALAD